MSTPDSIQCIPVRGPSGPGTVPGTGGRLDRRLGSGCLGGTRTKAAAP